MISSVFITPLLKKEVFENEWKSREKYGWQNVDLHDISSELEEHEQANQEGGWLARRLAKIKLQL